MGVIDRKSELAFFFDQAPTAFFILDDRLRVQQANASFSRIVQSDGSSPIGRRLDDLLPGSGKVLDAACREVLRTGEASSGLPLEGVAVPAEHLGQTWCVSCFPIDSNESSTRLIAGSFALSGDEGRPLEAEDAPLARQGIARQLRQAQKMEAIGTLAGGMAHDFNNILASLMGYTDLARMVVPDDSEAQGFLNEIAHSSLRARDLVQQLMTLSRNDVEFTTSVDLQALMQAIDALLRSSLASTIKLVVERDQACGAVVGDESQIRQVVLNLCANAVEAIGDNHGTLEIALKQVSFDATEAAARNLGTPGSYAHVRVADDGTGMDEEILDHIFQPYFTTKGFSDGTGLGLTCVLGIVNSHNGAINCESTPGKGTVFDVYLPLELQDVQDGSALPCTEGESSGSGGEHILLVDDEKMILRVNRMMLEKRGYRVSTCEDPSEALAMFDACPGEFDLLVTDQTMPGMTGLELAKKVLVRRPDLPIILCTGKCDRSMKQEAIEAGIHNFASKPIRMKDLVHQVNHLLASLSPARC